MAAPSPVFLVALPFRELLECPPQSKSLVFQSPQGASPLWSLPVYLTAPRCLKEAPERQLVWGFPWPPSPLPTLTFLLPLPGGVQGGSSLCPECCSSTDTTELGFFTQMPSSGWSVHEFPSHFLFLLSSWYLTSLTQKRFPLLDFLVSP